MGTWLRKLHVELARELKKNLLYTWLWKRFLGSQQMVELLPHLLIWFSYVRENLESLQTVSQQDPLPRSSSEPYSPQHTKPENLKSKIPLIWHLREPTKRNLETSLPNLKREARLSPTTDALCKRSSRRTSLFKQKAWNPFPPSFYSTTVWTTHPFCRCCGFFFCDAHERHTGDNKSDSGNRTAAKRVKLPGTGRVPSSAVKNRRFQTRWYPGGPYPELRADGWTGGLVDGRTGGRTNGSEPAWNWNRLIRCKKNRRYNN